MSAVAVDHVVTRDQVVWGFGPDLEPVLEAVSYTHLTLPTKA